MIKRILALIGMAAISVSAFALTPDIQLVSGNPVTPTTVDVKARDLALVCPGAFFVSGTGTKVGDFKQSGTSSVSLYRGSTTGLVISGQELGRNASNLTGSKIETKKSFLLTANNPDATASQGSALMTANQLQLMATPSVNGLIGATCQRPGSDLWIVGGDTSTGREALLILSNSTKVDSTVELQLLSSSGFASVPGLSAISVPARQSIIVPINGLLPKASTFAVHVSARGGAIAAWIQQKTVRGLRSSGVDLIAPTANAAKELVIPGFLVRGSKFAATLIARGEQYADIADTLRISNATAKPATVLAKITGASNKTFGTVIQATVPAKTSVDLPISGIDDGDYAIFISSDQPVRAGAKLNRSSPTGKPRTEFTWLAAVEASEGDRFMAVPADGISKLAVANPTTKPVTVRINDAAGAITLAPGALASIRVSSPYVKVSSTGKVSATLVVDINSALAAMPMVEYRNVGGSVSVVVR
jgi:hypothetical protein